MTEILICLAVWRVSSLLVNEAGPFEVFSKLRYAVGVRYDEYSARTGKGLAGAFTCIWCMSVWVAFPFAAALALERSYDLLALVTDWLAFSAGAIIIASAIERINAIPGRRW